MYVCVWEHKTARRSQSVSKNNMKLNGDYYGRHVYFRFWKGYEAGQARDFTLTDRQVDTRGVDSTVITGEILIKL